MVAITAEFLRSHVQAAEQGMKVATIEADQAKRDLAAAERTFAFNEGMRQFAAFLVKKAEEPEPRAPEKKKDPPAPPTAETTPAAGEAAEKAAGDTGAPEAETVRDGQEADTSAP